MFQAVPPPIIRSSKLHKRHRVSVQLFLLLTAIVSELELTMRGPMKVKINYLRDVVVKVAANSFKKDFEINFIGTLNCSLMTPTNAPSTHTHKSHTVPTCFGINYATQREFYTKIQELLKYKRLQT
jgi:hypothetical protein